MPKPSRTKNFGRSIHTGSSAKEGADPIQYISKADKKAYQAEEKLESNSRGSSLHEEDGAVPRAPPRITDSSDDEASPRQAADSSVVEHTAAPTSTEPLADVTPVAAESSGMERVPTDSNKAAAVLGGEPTTAASPPKKRKSVKSTKTGTTTHKRKSSADAGLAPLSPVKTEQPAPPEIVVPTAPTTEKVVPTSPTKSTSSGKDGQLKKRPSTKSKTHTRGKSGDASVLSEDHTLHLTGETASTGLQKRPSTKSNKTGRRASVTPSSAGAAVKTLH